MPSKGALGKSVGSGGSSRCSKTSSVSSSVVRTTTNHHTSKSYVHSTTITRREVQTPTSCRSSKTLTVTETVHQNPVRSILPAITKSSESK
ncbi:unnamed protein product [Schistosoma guineensis]|nr:unnamed protein product [Schistosoma guineensis]